MLSKSHYINWIEYEFNSKISSNLKKLKHRTNNKCQMRVLTRKRNAMAKKGTALHTDNENNRFDAHKSK